MSSFVSRVRDLLRPASIIDPGLPLDQVPFAVVDTELTGLNAKCDSVVSVGAVKMSGTRIELGRALHRLVSPQATFNRESIMVHGITPDDVAEKPQIDVVAAELLEFCGDRVVAGHFLAIDLAFLGKESAAIRAADWRRRAVDTAVIHEWIRQQRLRLAAGYSVAEGERSLVALAQSRGIRVGGLHHALTDAFVTAQLLQRQLRELPGFGVRTLGDLLRIGKP